MIGSEGREQCGHGRTICVSARALHGSLAYLADHANNEGMRDTVEHTVICQYRPRAGAVDDFMTLGPRAPERPDRPRFGDSSARGRLRRRGPRRQRPADRVHLPVARSRGIATRSAAPAGRRDLGAHGDARRGPADGPWDGFPPLLDERVPLNPRSRGLRELDELEAVFAALANEHRRHILVDAARPRRCDDGRTARRSVQPLVVDDDATPAEARGSRADPVEKQGRERLYTLDAEHLRGQ